MRFTRLQNVVSVAGLLLGPAVVSAGPLTRRDVECFFDTPAENGDTCEAFASSWGISVEEFINLNPDVTCHNLEAGNSYCVIGEYTPDEPATPMAEPQPPAITTTKPPTNTSTQSSSTLQTITTTTSAADSGVSPIMPGAAGDGDSYHKIQFGDTCDAVASKRVITVAQLKSWNTEINDSCSNLWLDYYVCTAVPGATAPTTTTTTGQPEPTVSPIMPGADANCNRYHKIQSGDTCEGVASKNGITVAQLKSWNTEINTSCSNLWLDYYICTLVPGADVPPTPPTPSNSPQLPGAVSNCKKWYKIASGDTCDTVAAKNKITVAMLRSYNTQINSNTFPAWRALESDCVSDLLTFSFGIGCNNIMKDYYACVAIPGAATPMPGVVASCSRYYKVASGDSCDGIAQKQGITVANFRKWNTEINAGCTNLWLDALVCTRA